MKITLNLATRPYADQGPAIKRLRIGMAVLAGLLVVLGLGLMHFHKAALRMQAQEAELDQSIARIGQEQNGYQRQMQEPDNARVLQQAEFLNDLFEEKSFSWTAAMEDLERVLPAGVQVTAIEPDRGKDGRLTLRLKISGQRERSVEMVRNMERSPRFTNPRVAGENAETNNSLGDLQQVHDAAKVSFDVLAEYNPATLDERKAEIAAQKRHPVAASAGAGAAGRAQPAVTRPPFAQPIPQTGPGTGFIPSPGQVPGQGMGPQPGTPPAGQYPGIRRNRPPGSLPPPTQGGPQ